MHRLLGSRILAHPALRIAVAESNQSFARTCRFSSIAIRNSVSKRCVGASSYAWSKNMCGRRTGLLFQSRDLCTPSGGRREVDEEEVRFARKKVEEAKLILEDLELKLQEAIKVSRKSSDSRDHVRFLQCTEERAAAQAHLDKVLAHYHAVRGDDDAALEHAQEQQNEKDGQVRRASWGRRFGLAGTVAAIALTKSKWVFAALKLTKMAPLASMLISSAAYGMFFGPAYGVGMVGLIFVHEAGHAVVMKHYGVPAGPMVFIPFMGAVIAMKDRPKNVYQEAVIALGGPVLGSVGAGGVALAGYMLDSQLCFALADFGFMINLFNLLPIGSMDGGRISSAISPYIQLGGLGIGGGLIYAGAIGNPIFYLIMLAGSYSAYQRFFGEEEVPPSYFDITGTEKGGISMAYMALIAALLAAMKWSSQRKKTVQQLKIERDGGVYHPSHPDHVHGWSDPMRDADTFPKELDQGSSTLPAGWEEMTDRSGQKYYANPVTGESSWDRPTS